MIRMLNVSYAFKICVTWRNTNPNRKKNHRERRERDKERNIWKWACIAIVDDCFVRNFSVCSACNGELFERATRSNVNECDQIEYNPKTEQKYLCFVWNAKNTTNWSVAHSLQFRFHFPENNTATTQMTIDDCYSFTITMTHYFPSDKMIKMENFSR